MWSRLTKGYVLIFLSQYIVTGHAPRGTLIARLHDFGISPVRIALGLPTENILAACEPADGISDTLRYLLLSDTYTDRNSLNYKLTSLLVKAF